MPTVAIPLCSCRLPLFHDRTWAGHSVAEFSCSSDAWDFKAAPASCTPTWTVAPASPFRQLSSISSCNCQQQLLRARSGLRRRASQFQFPPHEDLPSLTQKSQVSRAPAIMRCPKNSSHPPGSAICLEATHRSREFHSLCVTNDSRGSHASCYLPRWLPRVSWHVSVHTSPSLRIFPTSSIILRVSSPTDPKAAHSHSPPTIWSKNANEFKFKLII